MSIKHERIVSDQTAEGQQLKQGFGGVGAILRYSMAYNDAGDLQKAKSVTKTGAIDDCTDTTGIWD